MNIKIEDITASFVSEKLPQVAQSLRDEGAKSVNADEQVAQAVKAEKDAAAVSIAAARAEGATEERNRIAKINALAMAGSEELVAKAIEGGMSPEAFAVEQTMLVKKNGGQASAKAALESGEKIASQVPATPVAGDQKLSAADKAKADLKALRDLGVAV